MGQYQYRCDYPRFRRPVSFCTRLRRAIDGGDVASFAPQHPSLSQIFKEVIR